MNSFLRLFACAVIAGMALVSCSLSVLFEPVKKLTLTEEELEIYTGAGVYLHATTEPKDAQITWKSSSPYVATVSDIGYVTALTKGTTTISATAGNITMTCLVTVSTLTPGPVDLGLSVKWGSCNIGAKEPWEYGGYFAWGETEGKEKEGIYMWETYKWCKGDRYRMTKYITFGEYGVPDNLAHLEPEDDVAIVTLGGGWRMPTSEEIIELTETRKDSRYQWEWKPLYGIDGWLVKYLENGNTLFLPAAGYYTNIYDPGNVGNYWSSDVSTGNPSYARMLRFDETVFYESSSWRCYGSSVRPVFQ